MILELKNVTLVAMTSVNIDETIKSLMYSSKEINFGEIKLISHTKPNNLPQKIKYEEIEQINHIDDWNYKVIYDLDSYINTEFVLLIHDDGFVVNHNSWKESFLEYDYIGAPWDHKHFIDTFGNQIMVGNSVSLRSKKLLGLPKKHNMPWVRYEGNFNEDTQICVWNRDFFLNHGIKYADFNVAKHFSHEGWFDEYENIDPFCFHNFGDRNSKYKTLINNYKI